MFFKPFFSEAASLLLNGSHSRYSSPPCLINFSPYTLLPFARLSVATFFSPATEIHLIASLSKPLRPSILLSFVTPGPSWWRLALHMFPVLSVAVFLRNWLLVLFPDFCYSRVQLVADGRVPACMPVVVDPCSYCNLGCNRPRDLAPLPLWRRVYEWMLE